jgi:predicted RNA-binding protein with PUA-like domain
VAKQYWLMKSEPDSFAIWDLERVRVEPWSGVRNYMARNHMRRMQVGDEVLFYHSSTEPPGAAGLARVAHTNVIDQTQFDPESPYYDPAATRDAPRWDCVDVEYVATFPNLVAIERMRHDPALADMLVLQRGMRLSVQPITEAEYTHIVGLAQTPWEPPPKPPKPRAARAPAAKSKPVAKSRPAAKAKPAAKSKPAKAKPAKSKPAKAKPAARARPQARA